MKTLDTEIHKVHVDLSANRLETGAVQFNDDWPGVFIRGDDCAGYVLYLTHLIEAYDSFDVDHEVVGCIDMMMVKGLLNTLKSSIVITGEPDAYN